MGLLPITKVASTQSSQLDTQSTPSVNETWLVKLVVKDGLIFDDSNGRSPGLSDSFMQHTKVLCVFSQEIW